MLAPVLFLESEATDAERDDRESAVLLARQLIGLIKKIRKLNHRIAINARCRLRDCQISHSWTLGTALSGRQFQVEWDFLKTIADRSPLSSGFEAMIERMGGVEVRTAEGRLSQALAWAAILETGTASFYVSREWRSAWIEAVCEELTEEGEISGFRSRVRNASCEQHVSEHREWLSTLGVEQLPKASTLWSEKEQRYPGLRFLERSRQDLVDLSVAGAPYKQALDCLESLNKSALNWGGKGVATYSTAVAEGEHDQRRALSVFYDELAGAELPFNAHAYFWLGKATTKPAGRIYFRLSAPEAKIVIAYVGCKLK